MSQNCYYVRFPEICQCRVFILGGVWILLHKSNNRVSVYIKAEKCLELFLFFFSTENCRLKDREQLLPGTQQRVLYNTIKYCSLSPLCPLVFSPHLLSLTFLFLSFFLPCFLASPLIHSLLPDVLCYLTAFGCE